MLTTDTRRSAGSATSPMRADAARAVRGGRVIDPSQGIDQTLDVLIEDGRIARLDERIETPPEVAAIDARGLVVTPGLVDVHVHLREPGEEVKETIATGLRAAARGGFTTVACMANTRPVNDRREITEQILTEAARHPYARVYPIAAISRGMAGETLTDFADLVAAGAAAFSDDGLPVRSAALMRRALRAAREVGVPIIQHAEDLDLTADGVMHEGEWAERLGLPGIPGVAEDVTVARDLVLLDDVGGRYHVAHLSTARSLEMVRAAKRRGLGATCEVTPHHLLLTDETVALHDADPVTKMKPPLRSSQDAEALLEGLRDGTVDAIASDHAPHHPASKEGVDFRTAPFGITGLETTLSLCLDRLVRPGRLGLARLVELLSSGPAGVLGLDAGSLAPGARADLTLIDLERPFTIRAEDFESRSRNSPFVGWTLRGGAVATILSGRPVELARSGA